jgi:hypothetical protein
MAFLFKLETRDGKPAEPPTRSVSVPNMRVGAVIPLGGGPCAWSGSETTTPTVRLCPLRGGRVQNASAVPGFRYSATSARGRKVGLELLDLTRGYEGLVVEAGGGITGLAVLSLVARARHLLKRAYGLADVGDATTAAILTRSITESIFTLAWLNEDPELAEIVWMLDEIRSRLSQHEEVAKAERRQRSRARRRGERVRALGPGESLGLLKRANVRQLRRLRDQQKARIRKLPNHRQRLEKLSVTQMTRMPSLHDRAAVGGASDIYSLTYRFDSNSAAHPNPLALERFLNPRADGIEVLATPKGPWPDPYGVGALLLAALLDLAGKHVDQSDLEPELNKIRTQIESLSRPQSR